MVSVTANSLTVYTEASRWRRKTPSVAKKPVLSSPLSDVSIFMILDWITGCDRREKCRSQVSRYKPTRVLDVWDIEQGRSPLIVVTKSKYISIHETTQCAALSYWDSHKMGCNNSQNYSSENSKSTSTASILVDYRQRCSRL